MKARPISLFLINLSLLLAIIYLWYVKVGPIKPDEGGVILQLGVMIVGGVISVFSILTSLPEFKAQRDKIAMANIVLPGLFIYFHFYWLILVLYKMFTL